MERVETPVLVVGAGPAGLTCALLLARLGIRARIVERRATPQSAPAAHVVNARTFEIFRAAGVDMGAIARACKDPADAGQVRWVTTLAGPELGRLPFERQGREVLDLTPTPLRNLSQHRLEPILRDELRRWAGTDIAHGHEWEAAEQDGDGVTSRLRDRNGGATYEVRSRWLVAADGASSRVRGQLGIEPVGPDCLQSFVMIHFEANLRGLVGHRPAVLYWTTAAGATGTFVAHDIESTWVYMHPWDPNRESVGDYSEAVCTDIVRRAMGTDAYPFTIRTIRTWTMTAQVAGRYRDERIFLIGDAAHRFPPTGGLGLNTGVQDAHNLAWKIGAVEAGWAGAGLLDSYDSERRPVAQRNADVSLHNAFRLSEVYQALGAPTVDSTNGAATVAGDAVRGAIANQAEHFDMLGLQLGFRYAAGALVADGTDAESASSVREYVPSAAAGARVPHAWVKRSGECLSSLDLFAYDRFTLLAGPRGKAWRDAVGGRVPIACITLGRDVDDESGRWQQLLGIGADGAVLVRPDQHVAWRALRAIPDSRGELGHVLRHILVG